MISTTGIVFIFIGGIAMGICLPMAFLFYLSSKKTKRQNFQDVDYDIDCEHDFQVKNAFTGELLVCRYCKWTIIDSNLIEGSNRDKLILNNLFEKLEAPVRISITSLDDSML